jgi:SM-20-related protein
VGGNDDVLETDLVDAAVYVLHMRSIGGVVSKTGETESACNHHWITSVLKQAAGKVHVGKSSLAIVAEYVLGTWECDAVNQDDAAGSNDGDAGLSKLDAEYEAELRAELAQASQAIEAEVEKGVSEVLKNIGENASGITREALSAELRQQVTDTVTLKLTTKIGVKRQAREASAPEVYSLSAQDQLISGAAIDTFDKEGMVVVSDAFAAPHMQELADELEQLCKSGGMKPTFQKSAGTRHDLIKWLDEKEFDDGTCDGRSGGYPALVKTVLLLKSVAHSLEQRLGMKLKVPKQCMAACYDGEGAHYVAHRDNLLDATDCCANNREVTCVMYPNSDWKEEWGGYLRCYKDANPEDDTGETASEVMDVAPTAGTLVMFKSRQMLHEVLPAHHRRMAVSCWILSE